MTTLRWTSHDLELLPDDGKRYEIVDGELYVSKQPDWHHQYICLRLGAILDAWSRETKVGRANAAPGLVFPELAIEVLSPGVTNTRRDREIKLKLYSRRGILEYWIVNWQERYIEVYRREQAVLKLHSTLYEADVLQSPHLPGFSCQVSEIFDDVF